MEERLQGQGGTPLPDAPSARKNHAFSCQQHPRLLAQSQRLISCSLAPYPPPPPARPDSSPHPAAHVSGSNTHEPCQAGHTWRKAGDSEDRAWCRQAPRLHGELGAGSAPGPGRGQRRRGCPPVRQPLALSPRVTPEERGRASILGDSQAETQSKRASEDTRAGSRP